jgi:tetratricopeptide (TPR) repeat protein/regulation of enolase protein 1 (concanavalin A-like superfamily)
MNQTIAVGYEESLDWPKYHEIMYRTAEFLRRLPYLEELRPSYIHVWLVNLADKNLDQALAWLQELEERATRDHDLLALLEAHLSIASTRIRTGDLHGTLPQVQQTLEFSARIGHLLHELRSMYLAGSILLGLGDPQQAESPATKTVQVTKAVQDRRGMAFSLQFAGRASLCLGHPEDAIDAFRQAAGLFREARLPFCEAWATCHLGRAHLAQGESQEAANCFQAALSLASQSELGGYVHWSNYVLVIPNPTVADALSGLEEAEQDRGAFRALCRHFRAQAGDGPFVQWSLEPATPLYVGDEPLQHEGFVEALSPEWAWHDPFGDCTYAVRAGLEMRAANGRDLLHVNRSAPRLLRTMSGDWAVQARCVPVSEDRPTIGGLVLWVDDENYLRLDWGATGERDLYFGGSLDNRDILIGRGRLPPGDTEEDLRGVFLRLERIGERVNAFCSTDGERWFTVGSVRFPVEGPVQVGVHAIGKIDRAVYRGAYPDGTAIRFESFHIWRL